MLSRMLTGSTSRSLVTGALITTCVLAPAITFACPACFTATGTDGLHAYYLSTILLSMMPFLLIGLIATIAYSAKRRRYRQSADDPA